MNRRSFITGLAGILVAHQAPALIIPGRVPQVNGLFLGGVGRYSFAWDPAGAVDAVSYIVLTEAGGKLLAMWPAREVVAPYRGEFHEWVVEARP